jgi:hypothetical protein
MTHGLSAGIEAWERQKHLSLVAKTKKGLLARRSWSLAWKHVAESWAAINRDWANRAGRQTFPDTTKADAEHKKLNLAPGRQATIGPGACDQTPSSLDCGRAEFRKKRHKHRPSSKKGQEERNRCISKN